MISRRRIVLTFCIVLLGGIALGPARGSNRSEGTAPVSGPVAVDGLRIQASLPAGQSPAKWEGEPLFAVVRFRASFGVAELETAKLKSLTIDAVEGTAVQATVELIDGNRFHGQLLSENLPMTLDGEHRLLPLQEGLDLKFSKPGDFGLVAAIIGLITLTLMEVVLGIDNVIFLAIISAKLPEQQQRMGRRLGLGAALVTRLLLLATLSFLLGLTKPLFALPEMPFFHDHEARGISWRDLILLVGGTFLIGKSTYELHEKIRESGHSATTVPKKAANFAAVILQIAIIDIVFSLDSVITAVGMVEHLWVMIAAMIIAVGIMLVFAEGISRFVENYPTVKVLALSFLILIGVLLVAEGLGQHIDKGYIYFAMAFAVLIEFLNIRLRG